jgi:hypothetical protein
MNNSSSSSVLVATSATLRRSRPAPFRTRLGAAKLERLRTSDPLYRTAPHATLCLPTCGWTAVGLAKDSTAGQG